MDVVVESLRRCRCRTPSPNRNETKRNEKKVGFWNFFALALLWFSVQFDFNAQSQRTWCVTCVCLVFVFCSLSSSSSSVASSSTSSPCVLLRVVLLRETSARKYAKQKQQQKVQAKAKYETSATITTGEIRSNNNNKYENNHNNNNKVRSLKKAKESKLRSLRRRWIGFDCQFSHSFSPSFPSLFFAVQYCASFTVCCSPLPLSPALQVPPKKRESETARELKCRGRTSPHSPHLCVTRTDHRMCPANVTAILYFASH